MLKPVMIGLVTLHLAFPRILTIYPQRMCQDCDGYVALESCEEIGRDYVLVLRGRAYQVKVADCLDPADKVKHDRFWQGRWMADIDERLWQGPKVPQTAELWYPVLWRAWERKIAKLEQAP